MPDRTELPVRVVPAYFSSVSGLLRKLRISTMQHGRISSANNHKGKLLWK